MFKKIKKILPIVLTAVLFLAGSAMAQGKSSRQQNIPSQKVTKPVEPGLGDTVSDINDSLVNLYDQTQNVHLADNVDFSLTAGESFGGKFKMFF